jgi:hypothetical protein
VDDATGQTGSSWVIYEFARKRQPSSSRALKFEAKHWNFICDALESAEGAMSGRGLKRKQKAAPQSGWTMRQGKQVARAKQQGRELSIAPRDPQMN